MANEIFKRLATLGLCSSMVAGSALAANTVYRTIQVQYSGIKLVVDGTTITPKDAKGNTVEPFIYNGTTYLPVRAVGNAVGKNVTWDENSKTVYLGETSGDKTWLLDACPAYDTPVNGYVEGNFNMGGKTFSHGFQLQNYYAYAMFNLGGKYNTLSFDVGRVDGSMNQKAAEYEIYLDGKLSQTIKVSEADIGTHYDIPLNHASQLRIASKENNATLSTYGFANCELS